MEDTPKLHRITKKQAVESGQVPTKIFLKYQLRASIPNAIRILAEALVAEFQKDKTWFDKCLIHADGVTKVWIVKEVNGVQRMVQAEIHVTREYNVRDIVAKMHGELDALVGRANG